MLRQAGGAGVHRCLLRHRAEVVAGNTLRMFRQALDRFDRDQQPAGRGAAMGEHIEAQLGRAPGRRETRQPPADHGKVAPTHCAGHARPAARINRA
jgi:hypothetical protein